MVVDGRYRVLRELGRGAVGEVYAVLDLSEEREVALKLASPGLTREELLTFEKEFHTLSSLSHPNIVRVYDYGVTDDGRAYFTMELVNGEKFDSRFKEDLPTLLSVTGAVLKTLSYIHSKGLVHCDLKPENILVARGPEETGVKLLDFGLATRPDALDSSGARGTFAYMAPEMARWGKADGRADIYSLGVVLYEAATGKTAFEGEDAVSVIRSHMEKRLEPPSRFREGTPEELDRIISKMLEKEPSRRYQAARDAVLALSSLAPDLYDTAGLTPARKQLLTSALVGRNGHIAKLSSMLEKAKKGEPSSCLVLGDRGSGKSRLLQEIKSQAQLDGFLTFIGRCSRTGESPLLPIRSIAEQASMRGQIFESEHASPSLSPEGDDKTDAAILFSKTYDSLASLSKKEKRPILLAIEDYNFADEMTQKIVPFIARSLKTEHIMLLVTSEPEEPGILSGHRLLDEAPFALLQVGPLKRSQTGEMIGQMLGSDRALPELVEWVYAHSEGNPLLVEESLIAAVASSAVEMAEGQWLVDAEKLNETKPVESVTGIVDGWLERLDQRDLELLTQGSVLGDAFDVKLLHDLSGLSHEEFYASLNVLERQNILVPSPEDPAKLTFAHRWVRDIIYSRIDEEERAPIHAKALRAIESLEAEKESLVDSLAYHALNAHLDDVAVQYSMLAAERALKIHALKSALNYYQSALGLLPRATNHERPRILEAAGDLYSMLGQYDDALEKYGELISLTSPSPRISIKVGKAYVRKGDNRNALTVLNSALAEVSHYENSEAAAVLNELALAHLAVGESEQAEESARKALSLVDKSADRQALSYSYHILGLIEMNRKRYDEAIEYNLKSMELKEALGDTKGIAGSRINLGILYWNKGMYEEAVDSYKKSLNLALKTGDIAFAARTHNNIGLVEISRGRWEEASIHLNESLAVFERLNDRTALGHLCLNLGSVREKQGRWPDALSLTERSVTLFEEMGQQVNLASALQTAGKLHLMLGNMDLAEARLKKAVLLAERLGKPMSQASSLLYLGYYYMEVFQWKKALNCLSRSLLICEEQGASEMLPTVKATLAEAYTGKADFENARRFAEEALQGGIEQDDPAQIASSQYALALLSVAEGDELAAEDNFTKALDGMKNLGLKYEMARTLLEAGKWKIRLWRNSRRNDDFSAACSYLRDAEAIFKDLSAMRDLEQVHQASVDLVEKLSSETLAPSTREDQLKTIYEVSEVINSIFNLEDLLNRVIDLVIHLLDAERGVLMLTDEKTGKLKVAAGRKIDSSTIEDASQISTSVLDRVTDKRKPVMSGNALVDSRFSRSKSVLNHQIKSLLCVPLTVRDRVIGTIYVDSRVSPDLFTREDELFLESLANLIAVAIENSKHHRELHEERDHLRLEVRKKYHYKNLVGATEQMKNLYDLIDRVSKSDSNVLILGETGTGKELVARAIHYSSKRADGKFVTVVVSALPEPLLESELFGHKKGSFTGAISDEKGLFEEADGGTIFLDEIGDAPLSVQSKLLRVIEEGETRRVGDTAHRKVDVRVLCATNRNLAEDVKKGRFREDLYYRLNVISISIPPLRERKKDISLLAEHFLSVYGERTGKRLRGIGKEAMDYMMNYDWPGNVRELENCIERAVVMTKSEKIEAEDLYPLFGKRTDRLPLRELKDDMEKTRILEALARNRGNVTRAAKELGIHRQQLQRLMRKYSLRREEFSRLSPIS